MKKRDLYLPVFILAYCVNFTPAFALLGPSSLINTVTQTVAPVVAPAAPSVPSVPSIPNILDVPAILAPETTFVEPVGEVIQNTVSAEIMETATPIVTPIIEAVPPVVEAVQEAVAAVPDAAEVQDTVESIAAPVAEIADALPIEEVTDTPNETLGEVLPEISLPIAVDVAITPEDHIVVVGQVGIENGSVLAVAEYDVEGVPNVEFNGGAMVQIDSGSGLDEALAVAVEADGQIVIAGTDGEDLLVTRVNADGSLDSSFGDNGIVQLDASAGLDAANAVAVNADGQIVLGGVSNSGSENENLLFVQLNADGSLDEDFGENGIVNLDLGAIESVAEIAINSEGAVVAVGTSDESIAVVELTSDGELNADFGVEGVAQLDLSVDAQATDLALNVNDDIIIAASVDSEDGSNSAIVQVTAEGLLDVGFGVEGVSVVDLLPGGDDGFVSVVVSVDGGIIAAGGTLNLSLDQLPILTAELGVVVDLTPDGLPIGNGWLPHPGTTAPGNMAPIAALTTTSDGQVVTVGGSGPGADSGAGNAGFGINTNGANGGGGCGCDFTGQTNPRVSFSFAVALLAFTGLLGARLRLS